LALKLRAGEREGEREVRACAGCFGRSIQRWITPRVVGERPPATIASRREGRAAPGRERFVRGQRQDVVEREPHAGQAVESHAALASA
jgi:hypothetical protein